MLQIKFLPPTAAVSTYQKQLLTFHFQQAADLADMILMDTGQRNEYNKVFSARKNVCLRKEARLCMHHTEAVRSNKYTRTQYVEELTWIIRDAISELNHTSL